RGGGGAEGLRDGAQSAPAAEAASKRLDAERLNLGEGGLCLPDQNENRGPRRAEGTVGNAGAEAAVGE
ncbi:hypothetical protein, partial [uncultured Oscillibacter sp.]|uniref:hypothetical protein n=1 Tax=uncultured Oscillibacter sp. TaxID=876091 RepID=UPI0028050DDA